MALSAFADAARPPSPDELERVLGGAANAWSSVIAEVHALGEVVDEQWKFAGVSFGWSLRLVHGKRVILYLTPQRGHALVGAALGEKAVTKARAAGRLSERTMALVAGAPKYAEGRGVRVHLATDEDVLVARELARIKLGV